MTAILVNTPEVWGDDFPFSQAVVEPAGRRVHLTGQVAWDPSMTVIGENDPTAQTDFALDNIEKVLAAIGGTLDDIVSTTLFYVRQDDLPAIREVRERRMPARGATTSTAVRVASLVDERLLVEIAVIAVVPDERFRQPD
ncbi:MAG: RidA family protein [Rhodospirillales bacterium]